MSDHNRNTPATELEQLARKRAGAKLGWLIHAAVYLGVNGLLAALAVVHGHHWAVFPAVGWGVGLLIHGAVVFGAQPGGGLYQRLLQAERSHLLSRDPW